MTYNQGGLLNVVAILYFNLVCFLPKLRNGKAILYAESVVWFQLPINETYIMADVGLLGYEFFR